MGWIAFDTFRWQCSPTYGHVGESSGEKYGYFLGTGRIRDPSHMIFQGLRWQAKSPLLGTSRQSRPRSLAPCNDFSGSP